MPGDRKETAVGGNREVVDNPAVADADPRHDRARRGMEDIDVVRLQGGIGRVPATRGDPGAVRRHGHREQLAVVPRTDRRPQGPQQLALGQAPQHHRLVVGGGREKAARCIDAYALGHGRVHAGIDAQDRIGLRLSGRRVTLRDGRRREHRARQDEDD